MNARSSLWSLGSRETQGARRRCGIADAEEVRITFVVDRVHDRKPLVLGITKVDDGRRGMYSAVIGST